MKQSLSVSVARKGSGFLLTMNSDDLRTESGHPGVPREDVAHNLKDARIKVDAFLDEALAEPAPKK